MRNVRSILRWFVFLAFLGGLGYVLWHFLPRPPRHVLSGAWQPIQLVETGGKSHLVLRGHARRGEDRFQSQTPVKMWDPVAGEDVAVFWGDQGILQNPTRTSNGRFFAAWLGRSKAGIIDFEKQKEWVVDLGKDEVTNLELSPDGSYLAVSFENGKVALIETADGRIIDTIQFRTISQFSPTSEFFVYAMEEDGVSKLCFYNMAKRAVVLALKQAGPEFFISADGTKVLAEHERMNKRLLLLMDLPSQKQIAQFDAPLPDRAARAFSPDSKVLALTAEVKEKREAVFEFHDTATGKKLAVSETSMDKPAILFAPDSKTALVESQIESFWRGWDGRLTLLEVRTGRKLWERTFRTAMNVSSGFLAKSRQWYAVPGTGPLEILDAADGTTAHFIPESDEGLVAIVSISANGDWLAVPVRLPAEAPSSGIWETIKRFFTPAGHKQQLYEAHVVEITTGRVMDRVPVSNEVIILISNDGRTLISWDMESPGQDIVVWDVPRRKPWLWIVGIPAGLGLVLIARRWARRRAD
ncbi:MAG: WD40 repeat domain-containing protein [Gemmataceae bacterium]|nr:WD40 repeat domain-containing protein [Gemmataceae bacterium]MCI0739071.1 WD40 repeat domain-containing protein [Gemmataceae bacterium]